MIAGKLTERITLLQPTEQKDAYGSVVKTYAEYGCIYAQLDWKGGNTSYREPEIVAGETLNFIIRDAHPVQCEWRVRYSGVLYHVNAINRNRRRAMKTLYCTKVNE